MAEGMTLEEQGEVGRAFVADLLSEFGMQGRWSAACSMRRRSRSPLSVRTSGCWWVPAAPRWRRCKI